jgi:hypothetical protein
MYIVNTTNGNIAATINDGVADTTTDLSLIGKNYANYGELVNENFVRLLENFANNSAPTKPITGQLYYNTDTKKLLAFNGVIFKHINGINVSSSEPTQNITGDLWYDSANNQLKIYITNAWQVIYPAFNTTQGKTGAFAETVSDNLGNSYTINSIYVGTTRTAIFSKNAFSPNPSLDGFPTISQGLNLAAGNVYYGNANLALNSLTVNGISSTQFLRSDIDTVATANLTINGNLTANSDSFIDANLSVLSTFDSADVVVSNQLIVTDITTGSTATPGIITGDWSLSFGSSLNASYADLAERYVADCLMVPGHVVIFGGVHEITLTEVYADQRAAGVVSAAPAYLMNKDSDGYPIALQGKVPCFVKGPVKKGDILCTSSNRGSAEKLNDSNWKPGVTIGKSLEDHNDESIKLIQIAVGRF